MHNKRTITTGTTIVSISSKAREMSSGPLAGTLRKTKEVIYKEVVGKNKKGPIYSSKTVHELV